MSIHHTVFIIGATSGIGASLAHHIHAQGKTVIATGRRQDRLSTLASSHPGLQTSCFNFSDISILLSNLSALTAKYPAIVPDAKTPSPEAIVKEVTTNITTPMIVCQSLVPFFLKQEKPCSFILVGGGLAHIPLPLFPVYCPTKAALHSLSVSLRAQLSGANVTVTVVNPPWVKTDIDAEFKDRLVEILGGPGKCPPQMPLEEFVEETMKQLDSFGDDRKPKKEFGVGQFPVMVVETWRKAFGPFLEQFHVDG
ncbi:hypothetical protein ACEPPN_005247 [Leptodophora sp. 'Broadleaf-Isolate-01']